MKKTFAIISLFFIPCCCFAHPGKLDEFGGHLDNRSGIFHYHNATSSYEFSDDNELNAYPVGKWLVEWKKKEKIVQSERVSQGYYKQVQPKDLQPVEKKKKIEDYLNDKGINPCQAMMNFLQDNDAAGPIARISRKDGIQVVFTMENMFHSRHYQERLQYAQMLQKASTAFFPGNNLISLVDFMGNEVGGTGFCGVWVQK